MVFRVEANPIGFRRSQICYAHETCASGLHNRHDQNRAYTIGRSTIGYTVSKRRISSYYDQFLCQQCSKSTMSFTTNKFCYRHLRSSDISLLSKQQQHLQDEFLVSQQRACPRVLVLVLQCLQFERPRRLQQASNLDQGWNFGW